MCEWGFFSSPLCVCVCFFEGVKRVTYIFIAAGEARYIKKPQIPHTFCQEIASI